MILGIVPSPNSTMLMALINAIASPSILSLLGCRLMIHLKEVGERVEKARDTVLVPATV